MPELLEPTIAVHASYLRGLAELQAEGIGLQHDAAALADPGEFERYVARLRAEADHSIPVPAGRVHQSVLWWVDGAEYLGRISVRHSLTPATRLLGGHIGYEVVPSHRRRGHARAMLAAALPVAYKMGVDPALISCDAANVASRRVIEANGGRDPERDGEVLRFWVPTHG